MAEQNPGPIQSRFRREDDSPIEVILQAAQQSLNQPGHSGGGDTAPVGSHNFAGVPDPGPEEQLRTADFPHIPQAPVFTLGEQWKAYDLEVIGAAPQTLAQHAIIPTGRLYLFNVVVALEWQPSRARVDTLMRAFRAASDVLYDATNGSMAFGQVIFAGRAYLDRADIQILASNRFHPRSMVAGLTSPEKFAPIRLGRGIWRKDRHILLPWDENTGYRTIAHEWAHYALGLHDEYIDATLKVRPSDDYLRLVEDPIWGGINLVVPRILLSLHTLMETLDADELVPLLRDLQHWEDVERATMLRDRILNKIEQRYPQSSAKLTQGNPGPSGFPIALPRFFGMPDQAIGATLNGEESSCQVDTLDLDHCWLYTYRWEGESAARQLRMLAQGSVDARAKRAEAPGAAVPAATGFELLGALPGDHLLAIGVKPAAQPGQPGTPGVHSTPLTTATPAEQQITFAPQWGEATARELAGPPVIAVLPAQIEQNPRDMRIKVRVSDAGALTTIWIVEPGQATTKRFSQPNDDPIETDEYVPITHMDGIIALQQKGHTDQIAWVAEFSYGGNPPTTVRSPGAPISAGSSDGNLMIFSALDAAIVDSETQHPFYNKPIVTTRNYAGFEVQGRQIGRPAGYLFSVAAAEAIDVAQKPTVILYYDAGTLNAGEQLVIHRYNVAGQRWLPLPTYLPSGSFYAATPINAATAPNLVGAGLRSDARVEYYRLFSIAGSIEEAHNR